MSKVVIIGAGGLGRVMLDFLLAQSFKVAYFYDDNPTLYKKRICGVPVVNFNTLHDIKNENLSFVLAVLEPADRENLVSKLRSTNWPIFNFKAATSFISPHATLRDGFSLLDHSYVMNNANLDEFVHVHFQSVIGHDADVGAYTTFGPNCIIGGYAKIGKGVKIGMGARILPKIQIGDYSTIGAGAVVTKHIPAGEIWGGVPAKMIKKI